MLAKNINYLFCLLLMTWVLLGCESLVNDIDPSDLPGSTPKLVVESYLSPQLPSVQVSVSESKTIYGPVDNQFESIKNAEVVLSDGTVEALLKYDVDSDRYTVDSAIFRIEPGKTYQISVSANQKKVQATTVIPSSKVSLSRYTLDTLLNYNYKGDSVLRLRSYYNDFAGQINFYRHRAFIEFEITEAVYNPNTGNFQLERNKKRQVLEAQSDLNDTPLQNDINLDGLELKAPTLLFNLPSHDLEIFRPVGQPPLDYLPNPVLMKIQIETLHVDEPYYRFHRSWLEDRGNNPFTEPSLIYSNIQGGLGCFGSYQTGVTAITF